MRVTLRLAPSRRLRVASRLKRRLSCPLCRFEPRCLRSPPRRTTTVRVERPSSSGAERNSSSDWPRTPPPPWSGFPPAVRSRMLRAKMVTAARVERISSSGTERFSSSDQPRTPPPPWSGFPPAVRSRMLRAKMVTAARVERLSSSGAERLSSSNLQRQLCLSRLPSLFPECARPSIILMVGPSMVSRRLTCCAMTPSPMGLAAR